MQTAYAPGTLREKFHGQGAFLPDHHPARRTRAAVRALEGPPQQG
ncbi:MAG: hypothetical protein ACRYHA_34340 [Janthinobacterium lividum]